MIRCAIALLAGMTPSTAVADEPQRPPLAESMLTESATDIDSTEAGELEWEANLARVGARMGGAHATVTSIEVEWRILQQLGMRLEPSYSRLVDVSATKRRDEFGVGGALAVGLFHDFRRDAHVQFELLGRTTESRTARVFEPGDTELPVAADLVSAVRRGRWTLRATLGGEAGGAFAHAPVHTDLALLTGIATDERFGFLALEARADWARAAPLVIAPEIVADLTALGLPVRLGTALPFNVGAGATQMSYGVLLRFVVLTGREAEYARARRAE